MTTSVATVSRMEPHPGHVPAPVSPYISFVAVARNDDYGGAFLNRIDPFVNSIVTLSEEYALPAEVVIVEWNPPADRPRLREAVSWPRVRREHCRIRIVEVSAQAHARRANPEHLSLFEYIGKNAGVRRATGQFILVTNPDIVFSRAIIQFFSRGRLSSGCFYRTARNDLGGCVPPELSLEEQLEFCRRHIAARNRYVFSYESRVGHRWNPYRWVRQSASYVKHSLRYFPFQYPFLNTSGDFLLMHRGHWHALRGYVESPHRGHHLDSVMVLNALFRPLRQVVLPNSLAIYHQSHTRPENSKPYAADVKTAVDSLLARRQSIQFNSESWGFAGEALNEQII